jgi:ppGpp synthetase/RelA/SpoT-type nucleotidyltranferase
MRKEWWKSKSTKSSINDLVGLRVLHDKELGG